LPPLAVAQEEGSLTRVEPTRQIRMGPPFDSLMPSSRSAKQKYQSHQP
jgi:hypothetical protein